MDSTKEFQKLTIAHILSLYDNGQKRVLVADEVGLGKTIVAKGVINELKEKASDKKKFTVLYICSNANLIKQNVKKLGINKVDDCRLSMLHLNNFKNKQSDIESLLPLTPQTSFYFKSHGGISKERALMYFHLKNLDSFKDLSKLKNILSLKSNSDFDWYLKEYEKEFSVIGNYESYFCDIKKKVSNFDNSYYEKMFEKENIEDSEKKDFVNYFRKIFAKISLDNSEFDLIIMDEFQRFRNIINGNSSGEDSDTSLIGDILLKTNNKILLLSATPYKMYATLEELNDGETSMIDEEFLSVFKYLFTENDFLIFSKEWAIYTDCLKKFLDGNSTKEIFVTQKKIVEDLLLKVMVRTERRRNDISCSICTLNDKDFMTINKDDVISYLSVQKVIDEAKYFDKNINFRIDYSKSAPYLFSFMKNYSAYKKIKGLVNNDFEGDIEERKKYKSLINAINSNKNYLFLKEDDIKDKRSIKPNNARLASLEKIVFPELQSLLWIPASNPYYTTDGIYEKYKNASKVLVFSTWEMVPRMISTMLTHEEESLNKIKVKTKDNSEDMIKELLSCECEYLSEIYNAKSYFGSSIKDIRKSIKDELSSLNNLSNKVNFKKDKFINILKDIKNEKIPENYLDILVDFAIASPSICVSKLNLSVENKKSFLELFLNVLTKEYSKNVIKNCMKGKRYSLENVLKYCVEGNILAVMEEYVHVLNLNDKSNYIDLSKNAINTTNLDVDVLDDSEKIKTVKMNVHFALAYFELKNNADKMNRLEDIRVSFNSPFRPFVLATTSVGQEGLDFHNYCRKIFHWNLPHNPVDLEQREGRVNRFKCLAVRKNIVFNNGNKMSWEELFENEKTDSGLIPNWFLDKNTIKIESYFPLYPFSSDISKYKYLKKVLFRYRLALGQANQDNLINKMKDVPSEELFINLSPYNRK